MSLQLGTTTISCIKSLQMKIVEGRGQIIISLNTSVDKIRELKTRTSGNSFRNEKKM